MIIDYYGTEHSQCTKDNYLCPITWVIHSPARVVVLHLIVSSTDFGCCDINRLISPVPTATTYVTVRQNVAKEDDKRLRFVPYFGENDKSNFDISHYSEEEEEEEPEDLQDDAVITAIISMLLPSRCDVTLSSYSLLCVYSQIRR
jgi:hypothetical protein